MKITNRDISEKELGDIYSDFINIEMRDGVQPSKQERRQPIAEESDGIIGFASGLTNHKWFKLTDLWVREDYRRQGLGTKLLKMLEDDIKPMGIEHIWTWTTGFINPKFYEKQGYRVFTIFEDFYEIKEYHHIGYRKEL